MTKRAYHLEENPLEWDRFKELFIKKNEKTKFIKLTQGKLSLVEYEKMFEELSRYAPYMNNTEDRKARHFETGLRPDLYRAIAVLRLPTYAELLQRVQLIAKDDVVSEMRTGEQSSF